MLQNRLRQLMLIFAIALGFQAIWIVLPESIRPGPILLPLDGQAAAAAKLQRPRAARAAAIGFVRGDLWVDTAVTYSDLIWTRNPEKENARNKPEQDARIIAERALIYSPHRADAWLLLAALTYRFDWGQTRLAEALKMSYYTGPNEIHLVPLRLLVSVRSQALEDVELQDMVRRDIRMIITRKPDFKQILISVYKNSSATSMKFIENAVAEVDPQFLLSGIDRTNGQ
jgi:hypothetical protein